MKAIARNLHISSKKMSLVAQIVRGKKAEDAVNILKFIPKKSSDLLIKVIKSAMANAKNNLGQEKDTLVIHQIIVTEGPTAKRFQPVSRGRAHPILKRTAHVTIELTTQNGTMTKMKKVVHQKAEKPETTTEEAKSETPKETKPKRKTTPKKTTTKE